MASLATMTTTTATKLTVAQSTDRETESAHTTHKCSSKLTNVSTVCTSEKKKEQTNCNESNAAKNKAMQARENIKSTSEKVKHKMRMNAQTNVDWRNTNANVRTFGAAVNTKRISNLNVRTNRIVTISNRETAKPKHFSRSIFSSLRSFALLFALSSLFLVRRLFFFLLLLIRLSTDISHNSRGDCNFTIRLCARSAQTHKCNSRAKVQRQSSTLHFSFVRFVSFCRTHVETCGHR